MDTRNRWGRLAAALGCASLAATAVPAVSAQTSQAFRDRLPQDEVIYFVLPDRFANGDPSNDRGGLKGDRLATGFDPADKGFFHGGDLKGLAGKLDYIQGLGATAIWLAPIFANKPVQGPKGHESAAYHGYWITDFTTVDPHLGTKADFKALVDAAHARGLKVYMDIVVNHTADVIKLKECEGRRCDYRSKADYPVSRRGGVSGAAINAGFSGDADGSAGNFAKLTRPDFAYTPYVPAAEARVKKPDWLNDPIWYHNRGESDFVGESSLYGDFAGLDDLYTENPRVVAGFIDIYGAWIDEFGIDGFRVDTARHVNPQFWQAFVPAMQARAAARGIPNFHIFAEIADPDPVALARSTVVDGFPAALDFAFQQAATETVAGKAGTDRFARLYAADALYRGGEAAGPQIPTFLGNHDMGRFGRRLVTGNPGASDEELLERDVLAHALLMFLRGAPTLYYGDEQGFTGDGDDKDAREDMFASKVDAYNDNRLIGGTSGTSGSADRFDTGAPLYRAISGMAKARAADPALRGGRQVIRAAGDKPGLLAVSRILQGRETLVLFNTGQTPVEAQVEVETTSAAWRSVFGACAPASVAPGSYRVTIAPLDYKICVSEGAPQ
ncbi:alpha-amylase [Caulobacter sp. D4A]|uniref:alpha-amylase family glycosyl hydrolase n=1 Tax=unclassified Caulobacter TaxID=2648921 RepID=UPI000D73BD9E|nr:MULTISPECIES: alpha-amylase family glycosyl hydrolase [unclassified Caulobacter]PXA88225.1 alpha-amylase [Caulobacter sp. D4A]PXA93531.1 alpha-amylase [Caulobacter sp. D5]